MDPSQRYRQVTRGSTDEDLDLVTLIATAQPLNVTRLQELAGAANLRQSAARAHDTRTLAALLEAWSARGLVKRDDRLFECVPELRLAVLRDAAHRGRLNALTVVALRTLFGERDYGYGYDFVQKKMILARAGLAAVRADFEPLLEELTKQVGAAEVVQSLLAPALFTTFEPAWYEALPASFARRWLEPSLSFMEAAAQPLGPFYEYSMARLDRLAEQPASLIALAGLALERGDFAAVRAMMSLQLPELEPSLGAALAMVEGRYDAALSLVPMPRKSLPQGSGLIAVLHVLALIHSGKPEPLAYARRVLALGARKTSFFRQAHRVLKQILEQATEPGVAGGTDLLYDRDGIDCLAPWLRLLWFAWFAPKGELASYVLASSEHLVPLLRKQGVSWLASECEAVRRQLARAADPGVSETAVAESNGGARPIVALRGEKAPWELKLEGLERLLLKANGASTHEPEERLLWRVEPRLALLEPYLQKRNGNGWTRGRKLAIKHILPGAEQAAKLAPEDARVAQHAREEREIYAGYPTTRHYLAPEAFLSLVGHPRVYVGDGPLPIDVVRGQVQLVVKSSGTRLEVSVVPAEFSGRLQVVEEPGRLVVYALDSEAEPLLKWVGRGLSFPVSAQERVMDVLGRLAHFMPVQSFEPTTAQEIAADAKPWLRVIPLAAGLTVSLSVRPLGANGPQVSPGQGAPTLLGRVNGEPVRAERDFALERQLSAALLERSSLLEANQSAEYGYTLAQPEECLQLISRLSQLESEVNVEWPQGNPLRLRGRATRRALRGRVHSAADFFLATGALAVDADLTLELEELLTLVSDSPGRFVRLASGDYLEIEQELRDALESLAAARSEAGRRSAGKRGLEGIPVAKTALTALEQLTAKDSGFELDPKTQAYRQRVEAAFERRYQPPRRLEAELRGYQEEGFRWLARLAELELGACLADDMGLGKTIQILALLLHRSKVGPALVVTPTSVCDNWRGEIASFAPSLRVRWFLGAEREAELDELRAGQVVITSYNLLQQDIERLKDIEWSTVVLDEAQFIKNADSLRARAAASLKGRFRIAATGTPVENHVGDLFGIFQFLLPDLLGSRGNFNKRFALEAQGEAGNVARRSLRRLLQPFILRRTKMQVLSELPGLTEVSRTVTLTPTEATLYESLRRAALAKLLATPSVASGNGKQRAEAEAALDPRARFQVLAEITRLRRLCCHPELVAPGASAESSKISSLLELVDELIEGRHRALVFSQFVDMLALVRAALDARQISYQYLDGSTPAPQRKVAVDAFQAGEGDLFLISLRAGGFGLNLTGADYVIHLDPWWNPAVEAQATDRTHRIGQTRPVTVYRLITANTIEERIIALHQKKRELADALLEDSDRSAKLTARELRELLE